MITLDEAIKNRKGCLDYLKAAKGYVNPDSLDAVTYSVIALEGMKGHREDSELLTDAIRHCLEKARENEEKGCVGCAQDHERLAGWLAELALLREKVSK